MLEHQHLGPVAKPQPGSAAAAPPRGASLAATMLGVQRSAGNAAAAQLAAVVARQLKVSDPSKDIPKNKTNKLKQTNAATVRVYLDRLCPAGKVAVDPKSGVVTLGATTQGSTTPTGCSCLVHMINSANKWKIEVTDSGWPHTKFDSHKHAADPNKGTGGKVTAPSPNTTIVYGAGTVSGGELDTDPWLVLGHELCGHAWMGDQGLHGPDELQARGEGGHQETVKRENLIRAEQGIELRGGFKDPNCGESYTRENGTRKWSSFHKVCVAWRNAHGHAITDKIP
jgi:hypothetical protein